MKLRALLNRIDACDLCGTVGYGLLVYGAFEMHRVAGFLIAGRLLLWFAIAAARKA